MESEANMTRAKKLLKLGPVSIKLKSEIDGKLKERYIAEFKPDLINPLFIADKDYDGKDPYTGSAIYLSLDSAVELAEFLKRLLLDEDPN
jgi:hypothetical protein